MLMADIPRPEILIIGGGFGGIAVAQELKKSACNVLILDKENYHLFQPLLYQVATAALSPAEIAYPIRTIFRHVPNISVYLGEVSSVDISAKQVHFDSGILSYDYLVLAAGATHSYFGNEAWRAFAPGLKEIEDATDIRKKILLAFEAAELEDDDEARRALLTFIIVGGGPTGVELAGALKEVACQTIPEDYHKIDTTTARVILIQSADRLLPAMPEPLSHAAEKALLKMGVELRLNSKVTAIDANGVMIGEERLFSQNVLWAAGVQAAPIAATLGVPLDRNGRVIVGSDLSVPAHPEVFVIGDMAAITDSSSGQLVPGVAQGAIQSGTFVGKVLRAEVERKMAGLQSAAPADYIRPSFHYKDRGTMATIGRAKAVAQIGRLKVTGFLAWCLWCFIHILFLVGFRNKVFVMLSWASNYFTFKNGARLITGVGKTTVRRLRSK